MSPSKKPTFPWPDQKRAAVSLTWDDARVSQADVGLDVLDQHGVRGTFYALPSRVEQRLDRWRAAVATGHEIGNHSIHHPCAANYAWVRKGHELECYTVDRMEKELLAANKKLKKLLGVTPTTYAYPCGQTWVGRGASTTSFVPLISRLFEIGRIAGDDQYNVPGRFDFYQVWAISMDNKPFDLIRNEVDTTLEVGGWLVLCGHDIGPAGVRSTTSLKMLHRLLDYLETKNVWVDTIATIGGYIKHGCSSQRSRKRVTSSGSKRSR